MFLRHVEYGVVGKFPARFMHLMDHVEGIGAQCMSACLFVIADHVGVMLST